jgi:NAD(P)-dependent dehydrogenase (short-subunit alcohol dehydrogenase family)
MTARTWLITGVSSGFGRELTRQLLTCGGRVIGTVRDTSKIAGLTDRYPDTFIPDMSAAITLMTKQRSGPKLTAQVLFFPVTDASFDTGSYHQFAEATSSAGTRCSGSGPSTPPTRTTEPRSRRRRCARRGATSLGFSRRS